MPIPIKQTGSSRMVQREAARLSKLDAARIGEELRELRLALGVSQADVARIVGVSRSVMCELEAGDPTVGIEIRRRAAIVLGADLRINVYPGSTPQLHDAAHARIVERILERRHRRWQVRIEVPVPGPGRASTDVRVWDPSVIVAIEVESHIRRWESTVRHCFEKRARIRAAGGVTSPVFAVLCLPPTRHHRRLVAEFGESVRTAFPAPPDLLRQALEEGMDWPGDGILWVGGGAPPAIAARRR